MGKKHFSFVIQLVDLFSAENGYNGLVAGVPEVWVLPHLKLKSDVALVLGGVGGYRWVCSRTCTLSQLKTAHWLEPVHGKDDEQAHQWNLHFSFQGNLELL